MSKGRVTLVPEVFAEKGKKFIQISESENCDECSFKNACIETIEIGRVYKVINLRPKRHMCEATEGKLRVVEVKEPTLKLVTNINNEFVGSVKTFHPINCNVETCEYSELCSAPPGIREGDLLKITDIIKKVECKKGKRMFLIQAKRNPSP